MHSAHESGLNAPIIGDDLYGTPTSDYTFMLPRYPSFTPSPKSDFEVGRIFNDKLA
jgi:23S rRNA-/tRNA-specific pseudouridylate synthase